MLSEKKAVLFLTIDAEQHAEIKAAAALHRQSLKEYVLERLEPDLAQVRNLDQWGTREVQHAERPNGESTA
jgi:hypothetical protein